MAAQQKLDEVLRSLPYQYQFPQRLRDDVSALLNRCNTLQPSQQTFSGQGRQQTLFYLSGVLPIGFGGATYNIPVTIYFDPPYPRQPPRCFVTPTNGMALKTGHANVDQGGMIYMPYLSNWNERSSTLADLMATISSVFSQAPPVYSTSTASKFSQQQQAMPVAKATAMPVATAKAMPVATAKPAAAMPVAQARPRSTREVMLDELTTNAKKRWVQLLQEPVQDGNKALETRGKLQDEQAALSGQVEALQRRAARNQHHETELREMEGALQVFVDQAAAKEFSVDDLKDQDDPDAQQVLDLLAEEMALEEYSVALDELLAAGKISVDDFLRESREMSRKQFICQKTRKKASETLTKMMAEESSKSFAEEAAAEAMPVVAAMPVATGMPVAQARRVAAAA